MQEAFLFMHLVFFDHPLIRNQLKPFTFTRPVAQIRIGISTISEKWNRWIGQSQHTPDRSYLTEAYLSALFPLKPPGSDSLYLVNGALLPNQPLVNSLLLLQEGEALEKDGQLLIAHATQAQFNQYRESQPYSGVFQCMEYDQPVKLLTRPWHITQWNPEEIVSDLSVIGPYEEADSLTDQHTIIYSPENLFVGTDVQARAALINAENGPVYIGAGAVLSEGCIIQGPAAIGSLAKVNPGAKIRSGTTIGPYCKAGGEISRSVMFSNSNKSHDGFIGDAVLGEWCNLGADTNGSNLKNNYSTIKMYNHHTRSVESTGQQFCGLMMGDHSKAGINTMFNTGTMVDVCANISGGNFPDKHIPSFTWNATTGERFDLDKALDMMRRVMNRRNVELTDAMTAVMQYLYRHSE